MAEFLSELSTVVGANGISTTLPDRTAYSRDLWPRSQLERLSGEPPTRPQAIVWPTSVEQVSQVIRLCATAGVPIVPFGAGSGVCGGARPMAGGVVVDLKRLKKIRSLDAQTGILEVEAGMMGERLERHLERHGLTLGHFPSSILCSTVGGWVAGRSAGQCSTRYGKIEDMVLDLEVVTGDGVIRHTPAFGAVGQGLDWNQIFIGSEGTLGIITAVRLRVHAFPEHRCFGGWMMPDVAAGLKLMRLAMQAGLRPAVLRLYDPLDTVMVGSDPDATHGGPMAKLKSLLSDGAHALQTHLLQTLLAQARWTNAAIERLPKRAQLVVLTEGPRAEAEAEMAQFSALAHAVGGTDLGEAPGRAWLSHRYDVSYKQSQIYAQGAFVDTFEVATTWEKMSSLYNAVRTAVADKVLVMAHFSHAYPGGCSIYFTFVGTGRDRSAQLKRYDATWQAALDAVVEQGATIAHHHGSGLSRRRHMRQEHGESLQWFRALKTVLDPAGILNPGKLFEAEDTP